MAKMNETHAGQDTFFQNIKARGYGVVPDFITGLLVKELLQDFDRLSKHQKFKKAAVGQGDHRRDLPDIRRDEICWIDSKSTSTASQKLLGQMENLKRALNQNLFLGLFDFEMLYSIYNPGAFYKRHSDVFSQDDSRVFSTVLYLNEDWRESDGGELLLYTEEDKVIAIEPRAGTLVCFLSHLEHEVTETSKVRRSCAGWFKKRSLK